MGRGGARRGVRRLRVVCLLPQPGEERVSTGGACLYMVRAAQASPDHGFCVSIVY